MVRKTEEEKRAPRAFCSLLREWRDDLNLSQGELAGRVGVSPSWISMAERAEVLPDAKMRAKLRAVLEDEERKRLSRRKRRRAQIDDVAREVANGKA